MSLVLLAGGCATDTKFPSLATREIERHGPDEAVTTPPETPVAADPAIASRLSAATAAAAQAERDFRAALAADRGAITAARGASAGSEAWIAGQQALTRIEASRDGIGVVLADLDALARERPGNAQDAAALGTAIAKVTGIATAQERDLSALTASLARP